MRVYVSKLTSHKTGFNPAKMTALMVATVTVAARAAEKVATAAQILRTTSGCSERARKRGGRRTEVGQPGFLWAGVVL